MPIDKAAALKDYADKASVSGEKWLNRYKSTTDKLAKATSEGAQKRYVARMKDDKVLARRNTNLKKLTEADLNASAEKAGTSAYTSGVDAKKDKWLKNTSPYLDEEDRLKATQPEKGTDVLSNVTKIVGHYAVGLHALKERQG